MPPIFQPEVAAEAVHWATWHPQRQLMVLWPTVRAIVGNAVAPSLADRFLARNGYDAQQTDEAVEPDRPDNLFEPVPGRQGAHGPFDARARPRSLQLWARTHGALLGGIAAASTLALTAQSLRNQGGHR